MALIKITQWKCRIKTDLIKQTYLCSFMFSIVNSILLLLRSETCLKLDKTALKIEKKLNKKLHSKIVAKTK